MRHSIQCALLVLFTTSRTLDDFFLLLTRKWTTGRRQVTEDVSEPHVWAEEAGQTSGRPDGDDTRAEQAAAAHQPGNTRGCSEGVSGTDGSLFDVMLKE